MEIKLFFEKIKGLGEFTCVKDRRRFNKKKENRYALAAYTLHFGHCKNQIAHHCDFELLGWNGRQLYNFYRVVCEDGERRRYRGRWPLKISGRGRKKSS